MRRIAALLAAAVVLAIGCVPKTPVLLPAPAPPDSNTVFVIMCGLEPGAMYAAHADSLDWRTYQSATARPVAGQVATFYLWRKVGVFIIYRTGR